MALNLEYLATASNGIVSASALAERVSGVSIHSTARGGVGAGVWDAVWLRTNIAAHELILEVHPDDDDPVLNATKVKWTNALMSSSILSEPASRPTIEIMINEARLLCVVTLVGDFDDAGVLDNLLNAMFEIWPGALFVENDGFYLNGERVLATGTEVE